eukprot:gnl/MRDRNA2_/MRDRNA2_76045_c0_seq1.p1 gnl/MRDRNA2_/MRDRNA2_76045_c0~~gnl/MRDRNA2_/MRDRNA2_76045_c0_seq1.p1  ORF type:complete len:351 (+),score=52.03 gnl/MRDRNA2_/MRDRNA2_76045_c0_seq1:74-1126(+)
MKGLFLSPLAIFMVIHGALGEEVVMDSTGIVHRYTGRAGKHRSSNHSQVKQFEVDPLYGLSENPTYFEESDVITIEDGGLLPSLAAGGQGSDDQGKMNQAIVATALGSVFTSQEAEEKDSLNFAQADQNVSQVRVASFTHGSEKHSEKLPQNFPELCDAVRKHQGGADRGDQNNKKARAWVFTVFKGTTLSQQEPMTYLNSKNNRPGEWVDVEYSQSASLAPKLMKYLNDAGFKASILFHGTRDPADVDSILKHGFLYATINLQGQGIYFTHKENKAAGYARGSGKSFVIKAAVYLPPPGDQRKYYADIRDDIYVIKDPLLIFPQSVKQLPASQVTNRPARAKNLADHAT